MKNEPKNTHIGPGARKIKAAGSSLVIYLHWTPIFELGVVGSGSKHRHQEHMMCLKEIELPAQSMITISYFYVFNILGEKGVELKLSIAGPLTLW